MTDRSLARSRGDVPMPSHAYRRFLLVFAVVGGTVSAAMLAPGILPDGDLQVDHGMVFAVAWSADQKRIAAATHDGKVEVFDLETNKKVPFDDYKGRPLFAVKFSPDSSAFVAAGDAVNTKDSPTAVIRQITAPLPRQGWSLNSDGVALAADPDPAGTPRVAVAEGKRVSVRKLGNTPATDTSKDVNDPLKAIAWQGDQIATGDAQGVVSVWKAGSINNADPSGQIRIPNEIRALVYTPDGILFAASPGGVLRSLSTRFAPQAKLQDQQQVTLAVASTNAGNTEIVAAGLDSPSSSRPTPQLVLGCWDGATYFPIQPSGQTDAATALGVSSDGKIVAWGVASKKLFGTAKRDGTVLSSNTTADDGMTAIVPFADGVQVAIGYKTGVIELRKVSDGSLVSSLAAPLKHNDVVNALRLRPGDDRLYSVSKDKTALAWALPARTSTLLTLPSGVSSPIVSLAVVANGPMAVGTDGGDVVYWDQANLSTPLGRLSGHAGGVSALAFAADGKVLVAAGAGDKIVRAWDTASKQEIQRVKQLTNPTNGLALRDPASAGSDPVLLEAGSEPGKLQAVPLAARRAFVTPGSAEINALAADGDAVYLGLDSGKVACYDPDTGFTKHIALDNTSNAVEGLAAATDSSGSATGRLFGLCNTEKSLWSGSTSDSSLKAVLEKLPSPPKTLAIDPTGRIVALGFATGPIGLWDLGPDAPQPNAMEVRGSDPVQAMVVLSNGQLAALPLVSGAKAVLLFQAVGPRPEFLTRVGIDHIATFAAAFLDGSTVALGGDDKMVRLWDLRTLTPKTGNHEDIVLALAASPDGNWIASGGANKAVKIWDRSLNEKVFTKSAHDDQVTALAFHRASRLLATGSANGQLRIWLFDPAAGPPSLTQKSAQDSAHATRIKSVAFNPDDDRLVSLGFDGKILLWSVDSTGALTKLPAETALTKTQGHQLDWCTGDPRLVVGATDKKAHLFKVSK